MPYTAESVLAHHGIDADLNVVRHEAHVVALCLVCASIVTAPDEASRIVYREKPVWECCNTSMVVY